MFNYNLDLKIIVSFFKHLKHLNFYRNYSEELHWINNTNKTTVV